MTYLRVRYWIASFLTLASFPNYTRGQANVLTQHNDLSRSGQNLSETTLTPSIVSSGNFGKLFSLTVDGTVEAQPLYVSSLTIGAATQNVVLIATEHDTVYAFDAESGGAPLWQASLLDAAHGAAAGATTDPETESGCSVRNHEYGITGTPVIDPVTGTFYVVSVTLEANYPVYRLHALDLSTGNEKFGGPVVITASLPATGVGSSGGMLTFDPNLENQRPGLAFINGMVYVAFGANCDFGPFHGWLFAYNATTLAQASVFLATPNGEDSGIWMGAAAPAADTLNGVSRMFITTGNGTYDAAAPYATNTADYGDDILRLDLSNGIKVSDAFTPFNQSALQAVDNDLGSSGTLILPDQPGNYPHLLVESSKGGVVYLVNRDNLGGYNTKSNDVVQELDNEVGPSFGLPAYWNGNVYLWPSQGRLLQFNLTNGLLSSTPIAVSSYQQGEGLGSTPSISANGALNAIVWSIDPSQSPQVLYAHDATNVANMLWNSNLNSSRDSAGQALSFLVPTVANGKVYVGSIGDVSVYGLLSQQQTITFAVGAAQTVGTPLTLTATASSSLPVSYVSSTTAVCTVSAGIATFLAAGTCTITASQAGNSTFAAAPAVSQSFNVTAATGPPPYVGYLAFWGINNSGVTISWSTDVPASTFLTYGTTTALGQVTPVQSLLSNAHGIVLTGLNSGTTYYFVANSTAANGATGSSTIYNFMTYGTMAQPKPLISAVTSTNVTSTAATITWMTDQAASSQVSYGVTTSYSSSSTFDNNLVVSHSVTLTGLTAGTPYNFAVLSVNSGGTVSTSMNYTFATGAPATPPVLSGLIATSLSNASELIAWTTDLPSSSAVNYGATKAYGSSSTLNNTLVTSHSVTLTGLSPGTTYNFDAVSITSAGGQGISPNFTFLTVGTAVAPVISLITTAGISSSAVTITWTTDQPTSSQVNYGATSSYGSSSTLDANLTTSHSVMLSGLTANTTYDFAVVSINAAGTAATSTNNNFVTAAASGPLPQLGYLAFWGINNSGVTISWSTDIPASTQVAYGTTSTLGQLSPLQAVLTAGHGAVLTGLTSGTTYYFVAQSTSATGATGYSTTYSFTTSGTASSPLPVISAVTTTGLTTSSATISWVTDQPTSSQINYGTTPSYGLSSSIIPTLSTSHSITLTGLIPGSTYNFQVVSVNAAGTSAGSANSTFMTAAATSAPPYVGYVAYWGINDNGATITWSTDVNATTQLAYGTTSALGQLTLLQTTASTSHGVVLTGLSPGTTYYFVAQSVGANGSTGYSTTYHFTTTGTATTPAPLISSVASAAVTTTSANITWTTDQPSSSQVNYGTSTAYGSSSMLDMTLVTSHSVALSGLLPGTAYNFDALSSNSASVSVTSSNYTFNTPGTAPAPVITSVASAGISSSSVTITWTTDQPTSSLVNFGTDFSYGSSSALTPALVVSHSVTLAGLAQATTYDFDIVSTNSAGISATSSNRIFTTSTSTSPAPNISYVAFWGVSNTGVTISWSTDVNASSQVAYGTTTVLGQLTPLDNTLAVNHGAVLAGLNPGTTYYFVAQSANASGNLGYSTQYSFTTTGSSAPVISGISITTGNGNTATINWTTSALTTSYVQYGSAAGNYNRYSAQTSMTTTPSCALVYVPSGVVHYQLVSTDSHGTSAISPDATFMEP